MIALNDTKTVKICEGNGKNLWLSVHIKEVLVGTFWKQMKAEFGQVHCPASSNFQAQFSTLCQTLPKMFMGSNIVVLYSAQYSVGCRTGKDRDSEIWTCKKMQARQHCFVSKRNVTKQSRATFPLLSVHKELHVSLQQVWATNLRPQNIKWLKK